jgi:hypothetical protein
MAKAKKPTVQPIDMVHYHAATDPYLGPEIYIADSQEQAIADLREDEGDIELVYIYEVKCIGKYKVNFTLEKLD